MQQRYRPSNFILNVTLPNLVRQTRISLFNFFPVWEIAVPQAVACGVYGDVFLCCPFSHEVSLMRS